MQFLVRQSDTWLLTRVGAVDPVEASVDDIPIAQTPDKPGIGAQFEGLPEDAVVTPSWAWVGRIDDDAVFVRTATGTVLELSFEDLKILDAIGEWRSIGDLVSDGFIDAPIRCSRLATDNRLLTVALPSESSALVTAAPARDTAFKPSTDTTSDELSGTLLPRGATSPPTEGGLFKKVRRTLRGSLANVRSNSASSGGETQAIRIPRDEQIQPEQGRTETLPTGAPNSDASGPSATTDAVTPRATASNDPANPVPVYAVWTEAIGPQLSVGMLTAAARGWAGGMLNDFYEIRRPEEIGSFLADFESRPGPAILLCSDYVWSIDKNLAAAAKARSLSDDLLVIHGGPSSPKYEADAEAFLREHRDTSDVIVRGEGEITLCEILERVANGKPRDQLHKLKDVAGLTFIDPSSDEVVRTAERPQELDLDLFPSPYLTGEFDDLDPTAWKYCLSIETNRGCPYGCTFCDWGSAILSRVRKFSMERIVEEFRWAARKGVITVTLTDANFGILARDAEYADHMAEIFTEYGSPLSITWTPAKNTTKHLIKIMDTLSHAGVTVSTALSLQTTDEEVLEILDRTNITIAHYLKLGAQLRRRGFPIQGDLMLGLPGQTFDTYKADIQFFLDHEIIPRTWPVQILPNAPMNAPEYREKYKIVRRSEDRLVISTFSFTSEDRERMWRFRTVATIFERMGLLRHLMRYLQWDHCIPATDVIERALDMFDLRPDSYPLISWIVGYFDLVPTAPVSWDDFYDEVHRFITAEFPIDEDDEGLDTVLTVQRALMPLTGRTFPETIHLDHDYVTYFRDATKPLFMTGDAAVAERTLATYGPAELPVEGDPMQLCTIGIHPEGDPRSEVLQGDFHVGAAVANELASPLIQIVPALSFFDIDTTPDWIEGIEFDDERPEGPLMERAARFSSDHAARESKVSSTQ